MFIWWETNDLSSEFIFFVFDAMCTSRCNKDTSSDSYSIINRHDAILKAKSFLQNMLDFVSMNFMRRV